MDSEFVDPRAPSSVVARLSADERRPRILRAFIQEALDRGALSAVGIRAVCAREGCTAPVVYRLFGDRKGLVRAAVDSTLNRRVRRLEQTLASGSAPERLRRLLATLLEDPLGDDEAFEALTASECRVDPGVAGRVREALGVFESRLVALLDQGRAMGELRADLDALDVTRRVVDLGTLRRQAWLMRLDAPSRIEAMRRDAQSLLDEVDA